MLPICKHNVINKERVKNSSALNLLGNFSQRRWLPVSLICLKIMKGIQGATYSVSFIPLAFRVLLQSKICGAIPLLSNLVLIFVVLAIGRISNNNTQVCLNRLLGSENAASTSK